MYTFMQLLCVGITRYPRAVWDMETSVYREKQAVFGDLYRFMVMHRGVWWCTGMYTGVWWYDIISIFRYIIIIIYEVPTAEAKQTADCTALQSQMTIEPWSHGTIQPSNHNSQMDQEYGLLPADARQQLKIYQKAASLKKLV